MGSSPVKISVALQNVQRLCIDTAPFIYLIERHTSYYSRVRVIFERVDHNLIKGFSSTLTLTEVLTGL